MTRLDDLGAQYGELAPLQRESPDPERARRMRAIRKEIAVLVAAENRERYPARRSAAAASSDRRRARRHRSAEWELDHAARACAAEDCHRTFEPRTARQTYCSPTCRKRVAHRNAHPDDHPGGWTSYV